MMEPIPSVNEADFLENEEFNFDLPVSPVEQHIAQAFKNSETPTHKVEEDEDEVFFGPVGFKEQCVSKKTDISEDCKPLSPLTTEQFVEIFKEANSVAMALQERANHNNNRDDKTHPAEDGSVDTQVEKLADSISGLALKEQNEPVVTPNRREVEQFKRAVKKDMRSPRRTTYTIAVSPAGQPPPPHLPTAKECVSSLSKDKPLDIKFTATAEKVAEDGKKKKPAAAVRKSKLPAKRSGIPKTSGLRKPTAVSQKIGLRKMSPPKRTRLNSNASSEGLGGPPSPALSDASDASNTDASTSSTLCTGKRMLPGSNNPVKNGRGLRKPGSSLLAPAAKSATTNDGAKKLPSSKPSLIKPGAVPRKTLAASRQSKLARPGTTAGSKLQPMKATFGLKAPAKVQAAKATPPNARKIKDKPATPKMKTPFTPVFADKKVVPKRILSSGSLSACKPTPRTTRAFSVDSAIKGKKPQLQTPQQRKPSQPATPQMSSQKAAPPVTGSARRRSGIPTPMRSSVSSSVSRLSSTSSVQSYQSPRTLSVHSRKTRIPSPIETPPPPKFSPTLPTEGAHYDDTGASPTLSSAPVRQQQTQLTSRPVLKDIQEKLAPSPQVDMLIKLDTPSPMQNNVKGKKCLTPMNVVAAAKEKENLIDFL